MVVMPSWTHRITLGNAPEGEFDPFGKLGLARDIKDHLVADYGTWSRQIVSILEVHPEWSRRISEGLPYILAEVYFAVTRERARTLEDVLCRRLRSTLLDPVRGSDSLRAVSEIIVPVLNWGHDEVERQIDSYRKSLSRKFPGARDFV
jgi:glycerol-3-phosphate dehydrogenase